ncbi:MAG: metallophosphoesterase [Bacteroidales bacterium]|jgi:Icc protein|nr:metallophosphoesterase [Bacteroidales bacterium]
MKLIAISDLHLPANNKKIENFNANINISKVISGIRSRNFDALIILGDIAYNAPNKQSYQFCVNHLREITQPIFCIPGNHDSWELLQQTMHKTIVNTTPNFEHNFGTVPFLFLDSSGGEIDANYVKSFLKTHEKQEVFVCAHHPIVPTQALYMEERYALRNRHEILDLLTAHTAPVTVVSGHYHCHTEHTYHNVRQIVVPSLLYQIPLAAQKFTIDNRFGFCELTLSNTSCAVHTEWFEH